MFFTWSVPFSCRALLVLISLFRRLRDVDTLITDRRDRSDRHDHGFCGHGMQPQQRNSPLRLTLRGTRFVRAVAALIVLSSSRVDVIVFVALDEDYHSFLYSSSLCVSSCEIQSLREKSNEITTPAFHNFSEFSNF